jgi:hypothetical protein
MENSLRISLGKNLKDKVLGRKGKVQGLGTLSQTLQAFVKGLTETLYAKTFFLQEIIIIEFFYKTLPQAFINRIKCGLNKSFWSCFFQKASGCG